MIARQLHSSSRSFTLSRTTVRPVRPRPIPSRRRLPGPHLCYGDRVSRNCANQRCRLHHPRSTAPGPERFNHLQRALAYREDPPPVVFLSGRSGVQQSVEAMKLGAIDFLTKTADGLELLAAVSRAIARDADGREERGRLRLLRDRHARLSPREREVLAHLISGQLNKQVGFDLGISEQTTKIHRHRILEKMQAHSIADLVRMASDLGIMPIGAVR